MIIQGEFSSPRSIADPLFPKTSPRRHVNILNFNSGTQYASIHTEHLRAKLDF